MRLLSELKRRNVLRMAALYLVAAWLVMQVAEVLMTLAALPAWVGQLVLVLLAVGFPIALVLSWFYELTPEGIALDQEAEAAAPAAAVSRRRVDVIIIEPGAIQTEFGDVMVGPMLERSGNSAYAELAQKMAKATRDAYRPGNGSPPSVIARTISKALKARRPRTRYAVGKLAKPMIFARKWFGDRIFDKAVMSAT